MRLVLEYLFHATYNLYKSLKYIRTIRNDDPSLTSSLFLLLQTLEEIIGEIREELNRIHQNSIRN